jgi:hypothetical protein
VAVIGVCVLFLGTGIGVAVFCFGGDSSAPGDKPDRVQAGPPKQPLYPPSPEKAKKPIDRPRLPKNAEVGNPNILPPQPLQEVREKPNRVNQAIDKGVEYLKSCLLKNQSGNFKNQSSNCGSTALAGLTLLSCGVPADHEAVTKAAERVRSKAPNLLATYEISACIWFLDKLNDPADKKLIRTLALRLVASQGVNGGWNYICHDLTEEQEKELLSMIQTPLVSSQVRKDKAKPEAAPRPADKKGKKKRTSVAPRNRRLPGDFNGDLKKLPVMQFTAGQKLEWQPGPHEDNSLTQFVILALWAAQKHGVDATRSLAMAEARFRASQNDNGSWGYEWLPRGKALRALRVVRPDSMTCAGLLGLAVGRGARPEAKLAEGREKNQDLGFAKDPAVQKALAYVANIIGKSPLRKGPARGRSSLIRANSLGDLYFLWSLERVGVVYNLQKIGGKDWYAWGSEIIVDGQQPNGSWTEAFPGVTDTCFALLFLKRVNVVEDLTSKLKKLESKIVADDPKQQGRE